MTVDVEHAFRAEHGRAVAVLVRVFGDIDVAEEAVQEAFAAALERWPVDGVPPSPVGWIITTPAGARSTGCAARRHATIATPRPCCWRPRRVPWRRWDRCRTIASG